MAGQREWAALWVPLMETIGIVLVVIAVLAYCGYIVAHGLRCKSDTASTTPRTSASVKPAS